MLFNLALHLTHNAIAGAMMTAVVFAVIFFAKERINERKRA